MSWKTRTWAALSLLLLLSAGFFWNLGNQRARQIAPNSASTNAIAPGSTGAQALQPGLASAAVTPLLSTRARPLPGASQVAASPLQPLLAYRIANTPKPLRELMRSDQAILLRSALIDTSVGADLTIPPHLKSQVDPGSYVVQARGPIDDLFRSRLEAAGARIVSYIPNNAYLVRANADGAGQLKAFARSVVPWEPYFKLDLPLLALAVDQKPLPEDSKLNVLVFSEERETGRKSIEGTGAQIISEDRSPFGHQFTITLPPDHLAALAQLPEVQSIEYHRPRQLANDITRLRLGVSTNANAGTNYLGLTGAGVLVNVNDTGIDVKHPALAGRVFGDALTDPEGHGTHVAGTLAGSGLGSFATNAPGSPLRTSYRGMAPGAEIYSLGVDLVTGPVISDSYLQETAARTNAFVSNNSWGYVGLFDYNLSAASFDAAVRDSLPGVSGSQPVLFVFAAGNEGRGTSEGDGGVPGTILAPATAKNVITVGAVENLRSITNQIVVDGQTNRAYFADTDANDEVASFSSRGNVGIGLEGPSGRFKPDVVAPGTFIVSARASGWLDPTATTNVNPNRILDQIVKAGKTNNGTLFVPKSGVRLGIRILPNRRSPSPFPSLPIYLKKDAPPAIPADLAGTGEVFVAADEGNWNYAIVNTTSRDLAYDLQTFVFIADQAPDYYAGLKQLNEGLAPNYRFESGTSMAAPAVSGILALMQEMFQSSAGLGLKSFSPALLKAMLINGARSVGTKYNLQVDAPLNYQGWGIVNLTNSIPMAMKGGLSTSSTWPAILFDQTNFLSTGQSHTRTIGLDRTAQIYPLRVTLVWTDPPGNPAASLKLVNDLDLIVTDNSDTNLVYYGNNIPQGSDFNDPRDPSNAETAPLFDVVNNVENVFINRPLGTNYTITVRAHRVNVNAVTALTNGIFQDYALVISIGNSRLTNAFKSISALVPGVDSAPNFSTLTNGVIRRDERVGANNPELPLLHPGATNQWNFYVYKNTNTFSNVLFRTFLPPNLSRSRYRESDIDLYVSTDPRLLTLDTNVLNDPTLTLTSRSRGGIERIVLKDSSLDRVYYVGVKSEDQQAAVYHIFALASELPFSGTDENGNAFLRFLPIPQGVPDGSPDNPGGASFLAVVDAEIKVGRVVLTNVITHENGGDLFGNLSHQDIFTVLNNHRSFSGTQRFIYDDSDESPVPGSQPTDAPGNLRDFRGQPATGDWEVTMIDNSPEHIGTVDQLFGLIEKLEELTNHTALLVTLAPNACRNIGLTVPTAVTNVTLSVYDISPALPVDLYVKRGSPPSPSDYDYYTRILPPGDALSFGLMDRPPLQPGLYYVRVCNPNSLPITFRIRPDFLYGISVADLTSYISTNAPMALIDDALTNAVLTVTNNRSIVDVQVGVRIDHPRASDLVLHLVSPQGTRLLLAENRGSLVATNFGYGDSSTNFTYATFTENANLGSLLKFALPPYGAISNSLLLFSNSFENAAATNYGPSQLVEDWVVLTNFVAVLTDTNLARSGSNVLALSEGRLARALPTVPDEDYLLTFAYRKVSSAPTQSMTVTVNSRANIYEHFDPPFGSIGGIDAAPVPKLRLCPGQEVVIIAATNCVTVDGPICHGPEGDTNMVYLGLPQFSLIGCWSRSPVLLDSNTVASAPFYIGTNTMFTVPVAPGDYYLFLGENDNNFLDNSGDLTLTVQWQQCQYASADYLLGETSNTLVGEFYWQTNKLLFTANPTTTNLILQPRINTTMLFDAFELQHPVSTVYYLPEESLSPLQSEAALGDWKLELLDDRAGPGRDPGSLLSWSLTFRFANTPLCRPLTNGVPHRDVVRGDEIVCFVVGVPLEIMQAANLLADFPGGSGIELLYSPVGIPIGSSPPDPVLPQPSNVPFLVTPTFPAGAELPLGQRYFLGVRNLDPTQTNAFSIRVDFDVPIIPLSDGAWLTNTIPANLHRAASVTNSLIAVTNMQYYLFDVPAPDPISATFQLGSTNGDVNLVLRRALPAVDLFPRPTFFDYESTVSGLGTDLIIVNSNSLPLALAPGRYYLGVYNVETNDVTYGIRATQSTTAPLFQVFDLTNGVPTNFTVQAGSFLTNFFRFVSDQTNAAVLFEIYDLTPGSDADLIVKRSDLPALDLYDFSFLAITNGYEPVALRTNVFIPHLNATNWFLTVANRGSNDVSGMICATVSTNSSLVSCHFVVSGFTDASGFTLQWTAVPFVNNYEVQVSTDLITWTTLKQFPAATVTMAVMTYTDPTPLLGQELRVYRVRQLP